MSVCDLARPEIVAMRPYSSARSEAGSDGILLNANELPWPLIEDPNASTGSVESLNRYPQPQHAELVERLADLYGVAADQVLLTRGSDDAIDLLVRVFCRASQDAILDTPPGFGMYRIAAQIQGAKIVDIPRDPTSLALDCGGILAAVQSATPPRIVFLTSPANPTGDLVSPDFLHQLLESASGRAIVVVDEAYAEFTEAPSFARQIAEFEHLVVLRTLSKAYAAAGLRCGVALAQPTVIDLLKRVVPPYPLATPVLSLALGLFEPQVQDRQQRLLRKLRQNKSQLTELLSGLGFVQRIWPGEANFVLIRVANAGDLVKHCAELGIAIRGFSSPLLEDCVRVTVGNSEELERLAAGLESFANAQGQASKGSRHG